MKELTDKGDKFSISEKRRMNKALKLYLKAAEAAGNRDLVKRLLALREEDDNSAENEYLSTLSAKNQQKEPLTNINQGNMHVSDLDSNDEKRYNYSRKVPPRNEFATLAMQWAFSSKTKPGDIKVLYNARDNTWNKLVADNTEERYGILLSIEDTPQNAEAIKNLYNEVYNENNREKQGIGEGLREDYERYWSLSNNLGDDYFDVEEQNANGYSREVYEGESASERGGYSQKGGRDSENAINETKYSRKADQDRSTLTKGEAQKQKANYESDKVYTKAEISKMVESLSGLSSIPKKFRTDIVNDIWTAFNSRYSPEQRERHASFLADKIFARMMQESGDAFDNTSQEDIYAMEREIHKALKKIAREGGSPSTRSKLEAEFNTSEAGYWKKQRDEAVLPPLFFEKIDRKMYIELSKI